MVWGPCGFLFLFSILEVYKLKTSRYRDIPWSVLNVSKIIFITLTLALCIADLSMLFPAVQDANITIYDVQFVTAGVKILAFVSIFIKCIIIIIATTICAINFFR